jgi:hypothetical protein
MQEYINKPYVYRLTHKETGQFYIGYREANWLPAGLDLGIKYYTSSEKIKEIGFNNFDYIVIAEFFNLDRTLAADDAYNHEQISIKEIFHDPNCLNGHYMNVTDGQMRARPKTGRKCSEETKAKMREARKKQVFSEESKIKMSKSQTGKTMSKETVRKIVDANTGKKRTEEFVEKMKLILNDPEMKLRLSEAHKGLRHSEESINKMRGRALSEEHKAKLRKPKSEEHKAKLRKPKSDEAIANMRIAQKGKVVSDETRANMKIAFNTEESKKNRSEASKLAWARRKAKEIESIST